MKNLLSLSAIAFFSLLLLLAACTDPGEPKPIPDFSACQCGLQFEPVCGADGRNYLNECFADCIDVKVVGDTLCPESTVDPTDTLTWPIRFVCNPLFAFPREIKALGDGTYLYQAEDSSYFRGNLNLCRCLPPETLISTPAGERPVQSLTVGDLVWTLDTRGNKTAVPILLHNTVPVGKHHQLVALQLADGRTLQLSPLHPNTQGLALGQMKPGDVVDGSVIVSLRLLPYPGTETMDILPAGETGWYYANQILVGSTLKGKALWP